MGLCAHFTFWPHNNLFLKFLFSKLSQPCLYSSNIPLQWTVDHKVNVELCVSWIWMACGVLCKIKQLYSVFCLVEH